jgi:hypothetical protein
MTPMTRVHRVLAVALACALAPLLLVPTAAAADLPAPTRTDPVEGVATVPPWDPDPPTLTGIRWGRHDRYDRTVFDFTGGTPGYRIEYGPLVGIGTGEPIPVAGAATLRVIFDGAFPGSVDLNRTYDPLLPTLRQIRSGGAFEGRISFGLGLADRVGFRVLRLTSPPRIAVDVAHQPTAPFGTAPFWSDGPHADQVVVADARGGAHPGYDRFVIELGTPAIPLVSVAYTSYAPSTLAVGLTAATTRVGAIAVPRVIAFNLRQLRGVRFELYANGTATAFVTTARRTGFRVLLLDNPARIAVDIAY